MDDTIGVLNGGYVRLLDWMGNDLAVVNAARASTDKRSEWAEIVERPAPPDGSCTRFSYRLQERDARLIAYLARHGHLSPFRHCVARFELKAPLMVARQWFKYRVGSVHTDDSAELLGLGNGDDGGDDPLQARNEQSRRYVSATPEYYAPGYNQWRAAPDHGKQGSGGLVSPELGEEAAMRLRVRLMEATADYDWALAQGICAEQARLFLPAYGLYTTWVWTCSAQAVFHFLDQRLTDEAQWEIRQYALAIEKLVQPLLPVSYAEWTKARRSDS